MTAEKLQALVGFWRKTEKMAQIRIIEGISWVTDGQVSGRFMVF
jgi:hypothetical protein